MITINYARTWTRLGKPYPLPPLPPPPTYSIFHLLIAAPRVLLRDMEGYHQLGGIACVVRVCFQVMFWSSVAGGEQRRYT
jgi:hypothetical protein